MEGSIDLSFESVEGMKQLPSTEGRGVGWHRNFLKMIGLLN